MMSEHNESSTPTEMINVHVDSLIGEVSYDQDITITLPIWQWIAIAKLAEHHIIEPTQVVSRWIDERLARLTTHVDRGDSPSGPQEHRELLALAVPVIVGPSL